MYKTMYQKYQIEDGKLDCEYDYKCPIKYHFPSEQKYSKEKCQKIPLHPWVAPRYSDRQIREDYTVSAANITTGEENGNSCSFFECPPKSKSNFGSVNQMAPFYKIGPHANLSDPAEFIYAMPNQNLVWPRRDCHAESSRYIPWYGTYNEQ